MTQLLLATKQCGQCLLSKNRIVPGERAAEIIRDCRAEHNHFFCHKGSVAGMQVHCRGLHDRYGSRAADLALRLGIPVVQVDTEQL